MNQTSQALKQIGASTAADANAAREHNPGGLPVDSVQWRRGVVVDGEVAEGYTVALTDSQGNATAVQFPRVVTFPTDATFGAGDKVLLMFDTPVQPVIIATGTGGGGTSVDFVLVGETWYTS